MALAIMKTQKFPSCRSAQDLNADEMKQVSENENPTHNKDDEKSGIGGILPDIFDNERKHQEDACKGKKQYDPCSWSYKDVHKTGICNYSHGDDTYYCSNVPSTGIGSGTGGLSAREAACLNKQRGDLCSYTGDEGHVRTGHCAINSNHWTARPLYCDERRANEKDE